MRLVKGQACTAEKRGGFLRHERGCDGLEEERDEAESAGEITSNPTAQGQKAKKEREDSKHQGDQNEGEHKAGQIGIFFPITVRISTLPRI